MNGMPRLVEFGRLRIVMLQSRMQRIVTLVPIVTIPVTPLAA
jgi:hypothetical protein